MQSVHFVQNERRARAAFILCKSERCATLHAEHVHSSTRENARCARAAFTFYKMNALRAQRSFLESANERSSCAAFILQKMNALPGERSLWLVEVNALPGERSFYEK